MTSLIDMEEAESLLEEALSSLLSLTMVLAETTPPYPTNKFKMVSAIVLLSVTHRER